MNFGSILLFTATYAEVLKCPGGKVLNPDFELELMHLQDVTELNSGAIKKVASAYSSAVTNLMDTFKGKVKFGYSIFSDDESPDGNATFAGYDCLEIKQQPKKIKSPNDIKKSIKKLQTVKDYDNYNCGFKALVLSSFSGSDSMINWSSASADKFRLLSMATSAPGKMVFDPWGCRLITDFQNCPQVEACSRFRSATSNGTYKDIPVEDDLYKYADRDIHYVNIAMNADGMTTANARGADWWSELSGRMTSKNLDVEYLTEDKLKKSLTKYLESTVMKLACEKPSVKSIESKESVHEVSADDTPNKVPAEKPVGDREMLESSPYFLVPVASS